MILWFWREGVKFHRCLLLICRWMGREQSKDNPIFQHHIFRNPDTKLSKKLLKEQRMLKRKKRMGSSFHTFLCCFGCRWGVDHLLEREVPISSLIGPSGSSSARCTGIPCIHSHGFNYPRFLNPPPKKWQMTHLFVCEHCQMLLLCFACYRTPRKGKTLSTLD